MTGRRSAPSASRGCRLFTASLWGTLSQEFHFAVVCPVVVGINYTDLLVEPLDELFAAISPLLLGDSGSF